MKILTNYNSHKRSQVCVVLWSLLEAVKKEKLTQRRMGFKGDCVCFQKKGFLKRILADPAAHTAMRNLWLVTVDVEEIELSLRET